MTYQEILPIAKQGYLIRLPNCKGFFKWDYNKEQLYNTEFELVDILNRNGFYYII